MQSDEGRQKRDGAVGKVEDVVGERPWLVEI